MHALEVKQLTKGFQGNEIVKGISLAVERGQLLALLGPSGCGKTTTLRMIAGLEIPDNGEIWIEGTVANRGNKILIPQKQRHIGMVFQDLALWPHMKVYENIEFGLSANKIPRAERKKKIKEVLNKVNMQKYSREYPGRLSGGQQQLIAIARAIVTEPKLLLMDEPLSNIDIRLREEIRQEIRRIQQETQITTVYVTHDQEDAFLLASKVAVMNEGIIEQTGTPEEIYNSPISPFIAHFIGESNMINIKVLGKDRVLTPWGELDCNTKGNTAGNATLFFRPHQARIEKGGQYEGVIISRDFIGGVYRYHILTSGVNILLEDNHFYESEHTVRFTFDKKEILPF